MNVSQLNGGFDGRIYVPSNIKANKQEIIWKLDLRNLLYILIGISIFSITYLIFKNTNASLGIALGFLFSLPVFVISFIKIKGMKIEEFLLMFRVNKLASSTVRINSLNNLYEVIENKKEVIKKYKKNFKKKRKDEIIEIQDTDDNLIENKELKIKNSKGYKSTLIYN